MAMIVVKIDVETKRLEERWIADDGDGDESVVVGIASELRLISD